MNNRPFSRALLKAIKDRDSAQVKTALDNGASLTAQTEAGYTALSLAVATGDVAIVDLLLANGAKVPHETEAEENQVRVWSSNDEAWNTVFHSKGPVKTLIDRLVKANPACVSQKNLSLENRSIHPWVIAGKNASTEGLQHLISLYDPKRDGTLDPDMMKEVTTNGILKAIDKGDVWAGMNAMLEAHEKAGNPKLTEAWMKSCLNSALKAPFPNQPAFQWVLDKTFTMKQARARFSPEELGTCAQKGWHESLRQYLEHFGSCDSIHLLIEKSMESYGPDTFLMVAEHAKKKGWPIPTFPKLTRGLGLHSIFLFKQGEQWLPWLKALNRIYGKPLPEIPDGINGFHALGAAAKQRLLTQRPVAKTHIKRVARELQRSGESTDKQSKEGISATRDLLFVIPEWIAYMQKKSITQALPPNNAGQKRREKHRL